jgi:hypothetical protein
MQMSNGQPDKLGELTVVDTLGADKRLLQKAGHVRSDPNTHSTLNKNTPVALEKHEEPWEINPHLHSRMPM